ncbi:hypothetical protein BZA05DRAFT_60675 [Tricharina praecox]|uniref:uncharacterized protein n=1 Tax=Tricharina praecox TaxID=43433 RepID=UPI0022204D93|nr:uncharacterized protein BZA05DRAFT_60675 [Tricharina praecox]KAI5850673.1 hypothetical protein BZA05DRAFT_60675 [Tricharina praecox]
MRSKMEDTQPPPQLPTTGTGDYAALACGAAADRGAAFNASAALDGCLAILEDDSRPLEDRYDEIRSTILPFEHYDTVSPSELRQLQPRLLQLLRPHPQLLPQQLGFDEHEDPSTSPAIPLYQSLSRKLLVVLTALHPAPSTELAAVLASFTSTADAWTTPDTCQLATALMDSTPALRSRSILIDGLLRDTLKPLFTTRTTSSARVTAAGRLAIRETTNTRINTDTPAWQSQRPSSIAILSWVLTSILATEIESAWGLLIPPILTLLDSTVSSTKTRAISMITLLLVRLDETASTRTLLSRTGLAPVFWASVLPVLSYLPPLTPTREAVPLQRAAYRCLCALALAREPTDARRRAKLLDDVVREGFLRGLAFADEHVRVVVVMVQELAQVVTAMGVWAVRHLGTVVPALAELLASPFGGAHTPLLVAAARTLGCVVKVGWPRMGRYVAEALRGVAVCWVRLGDGALDVKTELRDGMQEVRNELRAVVKALKCVVESEEGGRERWEALQEGVVEVDRTAFVGLFVES